MIFGDSQCQICLRKDNSNHNPKLQMKPNYWFKFIVDLVTRDHIDP